MKTIRFAALGALVAGALLVLGCEKEPWVAPTPPDQKEKTNPTDPTPASKDLTPSEVPDYDKIHMNSEFYKRTRDGDVTSTFYDPLKSSSLYYFGRSRQSEHFIIFWDKDYGTTSPDAAASPYHLDTKAFLDWCEEIYAYYVNVLKFVHLTEADKSWLDQYKFQIFLWHQTEWAAYGSGPADNVTGCLWVNPEAANSRATVAHEIGHSFQYQVACDLVLNKKTNNIYNVAFRYDQGNGSDFWEQTAQWMAYQMVPEETFNNYNFTEFCDNAHRHFAHEDMRYGSYFFHYSWTDKYGLDAVSKVWHAAVRPKDSIESYMSAFSLTLEELNAQLYDYAARVATWDFKQIAAEGAHHAGAVKWKGIDLGDGYWKVDPSKAPEATGFNLVRLPAAPGQTLSMDFVGLPNEPGYNKSGDAAQAGWTLGFVSLGKDLSTRTYSESAMATAATGNAASVQWTVPADAQSVWAVVACTPTTYITHLWDENNANDRHWPYKVKFSADGTVMDLSTPPTGFLECPDGTTGQHAYAWKMEGNTISVDVDVDVAHAAQLAAEGRWEIGHFELPVEKVNAFIGADVRELDESSFTSYDPDGKQVDMTSYKPGMWVDANGKSCSASAGTAFWQWYVWGGKTDKNGEKIWYDYDQQGTGANQGRVMVGMNPSRISAAKGKTISFRNKLTVQSAEYELIITYRYR